MQIRVLARNGQGLNQKWAELLIKTCYIYYLLENYLQPEGHSSLQMH